MADRAQAIVREVIAENQYMTIATSDEQRPWCAPVQFCCDTDLNFYFLSLPTSRHAQHMTKNPAVGLAIFDSQQPPFTGRGVQVDGVASHYSNDENPFATIGGLEMPVDLQEVAPGYIAYKVEPRHFYVPRGYVDGTLRDERLEVQL